MPETTQPARAELGLELEQPDSSLAPNHRAICHQIRGRAKLQRKSNTGSRNK